MPAVLRNASLRAAPDAAGPRVPVYRIVGTAWLESERYEITAKSPANTSAPQLKQMFQNLLAERFRLALPVYALVIAKNGPKLKEATGDPGAPPDPPTSPPQITIGKDGFPLPGESVGTSDTRCDLERLMIDRAVRVTAGN